MWKKLTDVGIMLCAAALAVYAGVAAEGNLRWPAFVLFMFMAIIALNDLIDQCIPHRKEKKYGRAQSIDNRIRELILLDEQEKPLKAWDLAGRVSVLIGRDNEDEPVDVNLEECEYSSLIDEQHAVLNYCMDAWYIEDLNSKNGIRIRKVDDGLYYRVMTNRPCRLVPGDLILIANTKLLIT